MQADMGVVIALLMKNEDVWLKMPSQQIYDEICLGLELVGIEFQKNGHSIQVVSLENKRKREEETLRKQIEMQHLLKGINKQIINFDDQGFLKLLSTPSDPPKIDNSIFESLFKEAKRKDG